MPELPEVEVTRRRIEPLLVGRAIARVETTAPSYFFLSPPDEIRRGLTGDVVRALERRGKYLLAQLGRGGTLLLHLGMSGQLFGEGASSLRLLQSTTRSALRPEEQADFEPDAHTHLRVHFADGGRAVFFRDVRKFGKVRLLAPGGSDPRLDKLGPDALEATPEHLYAASRRRKIPIKTLLLQQDVIAGVGNIYADEALFAAGVRPRRAAARVSRADCERIVRSVQQVLRRSIETGGSSISDYVAPDGSDGAYQDERRVYARGGEPCRACGAPIRRVVVGARGTCYCPACQR